MIIPPYGFDFLFYLVGFILGLDFAISGIKTLTTDKNMHAKPRLLGLLILSRVKSMMEKWQGKNKIVRTFFDLRIMAINFLLGGILLLIGSLIMLMEISKQF
jgi:hypothetical protein